MATKLKNALQITAKHFLFIEKLKIYFICGFMPHFVFSVTGASKKLLVSENPFIKRIFKSAGVVLAGMECSQKNRRFFCERHSRPREWRLSRHSQMLCRKLQSFLSSYLIKFFFVGNNN